MKKFILIFGVIIINVFVYGALFKVQHWPGGNILIILGLGFFCLVFLPLAFIQSYNGNGKKYKQLYIAGFICSFITFIGAMFKIQHWPGASWFLIVGIPLPFVYFLPVYVYHHNKSKEKSMINFLGVMFMMVYVALFTSILALNVSRDVLFALRNCANDISKTNELYTEKNELAYLNIEKSSIPENKEKSHAVKLSTQAICNFINNIKVELVKAIENSNSKAIGTDNQIDLHAISAIDESVHTTKIMRGRDGNSGRALELKNQINNYRQFLKTFFGNDTIKASIIDELLTTSDIEVTRLGEKQSITWEDSFFPNGAFLITILGNLDCIAINLKIAQEEALAEVLKGSSL